MSVIQFITAQLQVFIHAQCITQADFVNLDSILQHQHQVLMVVTAQEEIVHQHLLQALTFQSTHAAQVEIQSQLTHAAQVEHTFQLTHAEQETIQSQLTLAVQVEHTFQLTHAAKAEIRSQLTHAGQAEPQTLLTLAGQAETV